MVLWGWEPDEGQGLFINERTCHKKSKKKTPTKPNLVTTCLRLHGLIPGLYPDPVGWLDDIGDWHLLRVYNINTIKRRK